MLGSYSYFNTRVLDEEEEEEDKPSDNNEKEQNGHTAVIQKKFLKERKIFLWGGIDDKSAKDITEKLLYLELSDPGKPIDFFMNTPGGSITAGMSIYDTMILIKSPIRVIVTGIAASMGSILLCGAKKGNRLLYPNSRVLIHQPLIMAQEMEKTRAELNKILSEAAGQSIEKITKDTDRDFYMNAKEAIEYGLADKIVEEIF